MPSPIAKSEAIRFGWRTTTSHMGLLVSVGMVWLALNLGPILPAVRDSFVVRIVFWLLGIAIMLGAWRIALRFASGEEGELADLFGAFNILVPYLIAFVATAIIVVFGFVLLLIPGIVLSIRLQMFPWLLLDGKASSLDAITGSWDLTRGHTLDLLVFGLMLMGVNVLGLLALGVGVLLTMPCSLVAMAHVYRQLQPD